MAETLGQLSARLETDAHLLRAAVETQDWELAHSRARECARTAGQLLHRLSAMRDVFDEARHAAEVDRSLKRVQ